MLNEREVNFIKLIEERESEFPDKLNGWEQTFINDILERFSDYGDMLQLSEKQWEKIRQVSENLGL